MAIVYQHIRKDTNQVFYIGIGEDISRAYDKRRKQHWKSIVNKHGYVVEILHDNLDWQQACKIEIQLISEIGRKDLGMGPLVNLTNGGEGTPGRIVSKETRQLLKEKQTGKTYGDETKQKLSLQKKGVPKPLGFGKIISKLQQERGGFFQGKKHTDESKKKTSEKVAGEKNPFYGKKHTKEVVLGMSGPNSTTSKFTAEQVVWIRGNYVPNHKEKGVNAIARKFGVSPTNISNIVNFKSYTNV
jgi:hypothetical protein